MRATLRTALVTLAALILVGSTSAQLQFDESWRFRKLATVVADSVQGSTTMDNFPILVSLTAASHASVFTTAQADAGDIVFTDTDGQTLLSWEIEDYDAAAQTARFWVKKPQLDKESALTFYMYYGKAGAQFVGTPTTWFDYEAVYHYEDQPSSGILLDSGPYNQNGVVKVSPGFVWGLNDGGFGKIGSSWIYADGRTVQNTTLVMTETSWTVSAWAYITEDGTNFLMQGKPGFFHLAPTASSGQEMQYKNTVSNQAGMVDIRAADPVIILNQWNYFTFGMDASDSTIVFTVNGFERAYKTGYPTDGATFPTAGLKPVPHGFNGTTEPLGIGSTMYPQPTCTDCMEGFVDEFRIRGSLLTTNWVRTEFRNQRTPLAFITWGAETVANSATCD